MLGPVELIDGVIDIELKLNPAAISAFTADAAANAAAVSYGVATAQSRS